MKQYRIIRKNGSRSWYHVIQRKFLFFWVDTLYQAIYPSSLQDCKDTLERIIKREKDFAERKKQGNSVIIEL